MIVAIIPARGGSRGLTGKNLRRIAGQPMIVHTIRAALDARRIDRVIVSTDDRGIRDVATAAGAEVPFLRPEQLAADDTPTFDVIEHAVREIEKSGPAISVIVTLQPTSPLRGSKEIDDALALLDSSRARSVVSVTALGLPASVVGSMVDGRFRGLPMTAGTDARRQAASPAVRVTGATYVTRRDLLDEGRLLDDEPAAQLTSGPAAIDVDDLGDLRAARRAAAGSSE